MKKNRFSKVCIFLCSDIQITVQLHVHVCCKWPYTYTDYMQAITGVQDFAHLVVGNIAPHHNKFSKWNRDSHTRLFYRTNNPTSSKLFAITRIHVQSCTYMYMNIYIHVYMYNNLIPWKVPLQLWMSIYPWNFFQLFHQWYHICYTDHELVIY